jgi:hypothetical protein
MTVTELTGDRHDRHELNGAAERWARHEHTRTGTWPTGAAVAKRYGMSARWGQKRAAAARVLSGTGTAPPAAALPRSLAQAVPAPAPAQRPGPTVARPARRLPPDPAVKRTPARRRTDVPEPERDSATFLITTVVAAVCAAVSYSHIVHLALLSGAGWWAWVLPVPLDGMMAVAVRQRRFLVAGLAIAVGFAGSAAANAFSQRPDLVDLEQVRLICSLSFPTALLVCVYLLERGKRP